MRFSKIFWCLNIIKLQPLQDFNSYDIRNWLQDLNKHVAYVIYVVQDLFQNIRFGLSLWLLLHWSDMSQRHKKIEIIWWQTENFNSSQYRQPQHGICCIIIQLLWMLSLIYLQRKSHHCFSSCFLQWNHHVPPSDILPGFKSQNSQLADVSAG